MYFPDHLERTLAHLEAHGADLAWSPLLVALPASNAGRDQPPRFRLSGVPFGDGYDPRVFVFASAWLLTRDLAAQVGPWRSARALFVSPSQDWLYRASRVGARLSFHPHATVLAVPSSARAGSHLASASVEHDALAAAMLTEPGFRDRALASAAITGEREVNGYRFGVSWLAGLRALVFRPVAAAAMSLGVHPYAPFVALRYGRRGSLVSAIRRKTGLASLGRRRTP